ncbi:hypothetical protein ACWIUD_05670 [Helicobacter sp. 23-1044]
MAICLWVCNFADLANRHKARTQKSAILVSIYQKLRKPYRKILRLRFCDSQNLLKKTQKSQNLVRLSSLRDSANVESWQFAEFANAVKQPSTIFCDSKNDKNNSCEAPKSRPLRGAKNRIQGCSSATADFLLEADKRGSPPKSEKAAAFGDTI